MRLLVEGAGHNRQHPYRVPLARGQRGLPVGSCRKTSHRGSVSHEWDDARAELETALERIAREQSLATYADLAAEIRSVPLDPQSPELARLLCERIAADVQADRPLLSSLVVGRRTNRPGGGFFAFAGRFFRIDDHDEFWLAEVAASHSYYRRHGARRRSVGAPVRRPAPVASSPHTGPAADLSDKDFILSFFD